MSHRIQRDEVPSLPAIHPSARRHGIGDDRMRYVVMTCPCPLEHPERPGQVMYLGPDQHGVPLEVVAFEADSGALTIIHAMRLRPGYRERYEEVMRCL
jgi:hypothetical protein